ncbi:glycosyltransferase family 2 protein, partial [Candidatus Woesearchaeota archaeon]|nr:glycosyltransferase family 2 protein [Candidatus Woesearchaeota archaeon]
MTNASTLPRVLVGTPTAKAYSYCVDRYLEALSAQTFPHDVLLADNSADDDYFHQLKETLQHKNARVIKTPRYQTTFETVMHGRNAMCQYAVEHSYDYLFFVDQDTIVSPDALGKLLSFQKDIISGVYFNTFVKEGNSYKLPVLWTWLSDDEFRYVLSRPQEYPKLISRIKQQAITSGAELRRQLTLVEVAEPKLIEIKFCGAGCLLISLKVLEQVRFHIEGLRGDRSTEDIGFCKEARNKGFKLFAYTGITCEHL